MNLLKNCLIGEVLAPITTANNINSPTDIQNMAGWDGIVFIAVITGSTTSGVATLKVEQNTANSTGGMAALSGATATKTCASSTDIDNTLLIVDVYRPREQFVRGVLTSSSAGTIGFGNTIAIKYRGRKSPVTVDSSVSASASVYGPAEG